MSDPLADFPGLADVAVLLERYEEEPSHVRHVAALADRLFLSLQSWHRRGVAERRLLHLAALLHDIGWSQTPDGKGHHKESARLISGHAWQGLGPKEIALVAQTARYHRKSLPAPDHEAYMALPESDRATVDLLGGLLRVADALDRTHIGRVENVAARVEGKEIVVTVTVPGDWTAERAMAERKGDLLERHAGMRVRFEEA